VSGVQDHQCTPLLVLSVVGQGVTIMATIKLGDKVVGNALGIQGKVGIYVGSDARNIGSFLVCFSAEAVNDPCVNLQDVAHRLMRDQFRALTAEEFAAGPDVGELIADVHRRIQHRKHQELANGRRVRTAASNGFDANCGWCRANEPHSDEEHRAELIVKGDVKMKGDRAGALHLVVCIAGIMFGKVGALLGEAVPGNKYVQLVCFDPNYDPDAAPGMYRVIPVTSGDYRELAPEELVLVDAGLKPGDDIHQVSALHFEAVRSKSAQVLDETAPLTEEQMRKVRAPGSLLRGADKRVSVLQTAPGGAAPYEPHKCSFCRAGEVHTAQVHSAQVQQQHRIDQLLQTVRDMTSTEREEFKRLLGLYQDDGR
jgi:hypothetical protein